MVPIHRHIINRKPMDLLFGYDAKRMTHQPRTIFDNSIGKPISLFWDANGNMAQVVDCARGSFRFHDWDDENRLRLMLDPKVVAYYGYDGNGERVYKLTGRSNILSHIGDEINADALLDDAVLYPNPYIVITPKSYTKHYYAGTERLATVIGQGGFNLMDTCISHLSGSEEEWCAHAFDRYKSSYPLGLDSYGYPQHNETIEGEQDERVEYQCEPMVLNTVELQYRHDLFFEYLYWASEIHDKEPEIYFYHGDHLGSANWITDAAGQPIQYLHYAPFGELIADTRLTNYQERYKFTGKERDEESGYDYFGARYYWSLLMHWLSVDPLADKYPWITPYAYCNWNPIKYVDPDGREKHIFLSNNQSYAAKNFRDDSGIYIFGHGGPGSHGYIQNDANSGLDRRLSAAKLADHIVNESNQYKTDAAEGNTSMIFLYACHVGEGENNVAQQLSSILTEHETIVVGPIGILESSSDPRYPQNGNYDGVKNSKTGREGAWGVYQNGQLQTTIRGNRVPTKATVKCQIFFDNLLKSIKNFFSHENE